MEDNTFEKTARRYADGIYRTACHTLRDRTEAEDVTQTVLIRLYQNWDRFESEEHLRYWIFRVTVNESRKVLRSPWRKKIVPLEEWESPTEEATVKGEVLDAVMRLEEKYRLPVYLYYYEGFSIKEIARMLHTVPSTVQTRLQRAREKLKIAMSDNEKEDSSLCFR